MVLDPSRLSSKVLSTCPSDVVMGKKKNGMNGSKKKKNQIKEWMYLLV